MTATRSPLPADAEIRIARAAWDITDAADALAAADFPQVSLSPSEWREVVTATLIGSQDHPHPHEISTRRLLPWVVDRIAPSQREELLIALGVFAKLSQFRWLRPQAADDARGEDLLRLIKGALNAYAHVRRAGISEVRGASVRITPLALWVLGMIDARHSELLVLASKTFGREEMRKLTRFSGWPAMLERHRIADLRWLTKASDHLSALLERLLASTGDPPELVIQALSLGIPAQRIGLDPATRLIAEFAVEDPLDVWMDTSRIGDGGQHVMQRLADISGERGDVLAMGSKFLVIEPQGFMDTLLAFVLSETDDVRNSTWHETEIQRAMRKTWPDAHRTLANVSWRDAPTAAEPPPVAGEIDTLVWDQGLFVDVQAKSARSMNWEQRERLPVHEALQQHDRLRARSTSVIELLRDGRDTRDTRLMRVDLSSHAVIPITVGTDVVHRFHVGGSGLAGGTPRVLTTLDHLRLIVEFVPQPLGGVYWLDRYAQELHSLRFIDEIDFLAAWMGSVMTGPDAAPLRYLGPGDPGRGGFVFARSSEIEQLIALSNTAALAGNTVPDISRLLVGARAPLVRMRQRVSAVVDLLKTPTIRASEWYWPFARMLAGNLSEEIADALSAPSPRILRNGLAPVGFSPRPVTAEDRPLYRRQNTWLVVEHDGRSRRLVAVGEPDRPFARPRFDPLEGIRPGE